MTGEVGVFEINGAELTLIQEIGGLPQNNVQGIVSVGQIQDGGTGGADGVDLSIDINVDSRLYNIFEDVVYRVDVSNEGDATATNVIVDASIPQGLVFANQSTNNGTYEPFFGEWMINSLNPGETATLTLTLFTVTQNVDILNFVEIVELDQTDANSSNNFDEVTIVPFSNGGVGTGEGDIDLELSISADRDTYTQFENIAYTITLTNNGPDAATNVYVDAPITEGTAFTGSSTDNGEYNYFFQQWIIPSLGAGQTATLNLDLFALSNNVPIRNFVEVFAADQNDADSTPNNSNQFDAREDDEAVISLNATFANADSSISFRLGAQDLRMNAMYPNPTSSDINMNFESQSSYDTQMEVIDVNGKVHMEYGHTVTEGINTMRMDVSSLTEGIYFVRMTDNNGEVQNHKFIKIQ